MIIKSREYKVCETCGHRELVADEVYGCDQCGKECGKEDDSLRIRVFLKNEEDNSSTEHYQFCSWICVFRKLRDLQSNYFIELPYLSFDLGPELGVDMFWQAIRQIAKEM
jgi:hypothetical protein